MSNIVLKTVSLILGYGLWSILTTGHISTRWVDVPLLFYGTTHKLEAPEIVSVALQAKRTDLHAIDAKTLAAHINTTKFHAGPNHVILDNKTLFLPDSIKLVHYIPINLVVHLQENQS